MANRRFSAAQRTEILSAVVGAPTGVLFSFGGMEFDLVAISTKQIVMVLELLQRFPELGAAMRARGGDDGSALSTIGAEGKKLLDLARELLRQSAFYGQDPAPEDVAVFEEWFDLAPPMALLRELGSKIVQAAGIGGTQRDPSKAPSVAAPEPPISTPSMQPA